MGITFETVKPSTDVKWQKMAAAWRACEDANIPIPAAVAQFFGGEPPDPLGVVASLDGSCYRRRDPGGYDSFDIELYDSFDIELSKIPKDVTVLRVNVSY